MPVLPNELQVVGDIRSNLKDQNTMLMFIEELKDVMMRYGVTKLDVALVCKEPVSMVVKEAKDPNIL